MKKIISMALICAILFSAGLTSNINAAESTKSTESKLKANQSEQKELDEKINDLNEKIKKVEGNIDSANEKMEKLDEESESLQKDIKKLKEDISENQESLGNRLKVINNNYTLGYIKVILSSNTISDFLNNIYIVKEVVAQDKQLLKDLESDKSEIEDKQKTLENNKEQVKSIKDNLIKDKENLDNDKDELKKLKKKLVKEEEALEEKLQKIAAENSSAKMNTEVSSSSNAVISNGSWPVPGYSRVSSPFGYRIHPVLGVKKLHTGIDIPAPTGTPAVAVANGTVIYSGVQGTYGNTVMIKHDNGLVSLYAHNSSLVVRVGDKVKKGQVVSKIGSTGRSTGPHLHFEIRVNGTAHNPLSYL